MTKLLLTLLLGWVDLPNSIKGKLFLRNFQGSPLKSRVAGDRFAEIIAQPKEEHQQKPDPGGTSVKMSLNKMKFAASLLFRTVPEVSRGKRCAVIEGKECISGRK